MSVRKFSLLRQMLLAATLGTGFGTVWALLVLWRGVSIHEAWVGGNPPAREELVVKSDGTLLISSTPPRNLSLATYRDLNGRAQDVPDDAIRAMHLPGEPWRSDFVFSRPGWEQRLWVFMNEREPAVNWFFVHDGEPQGSGYFVGYESVSNRRVGFIGLAGFRSHPVGADERFPVRGELMTNNSRWSSSSFSINSGRWVIRPGRWDLPPRLVHVPSGNDLRLVDLAARTVATVYQAPEPIVSLRVPELSNYMRSHLTSEQPVLVRTRQKIYAFDRNYKIVKHLTIPPNIDRRSNAYWYEVGNGQAVVAIDGPWSTGEAGYITKQFVYQIAADGAIQDSFAITLQSGSRVANEQVQANLLAFGLPAPAILIAIELLIVMEAEQVPSDPAVVRVRPEPVWPSWMAVLVLSSVLAMLACRWSRGFGLSRREQVAWGAFVLLLGLPAYVGFRLSRRWPIRESCPHCHAQAARDRAACAECGARFPDPALKGIEIFA